MDRRKATTPITHSSEVSRGSPEKNSLPARNLKMHRFQKHILDRSLKQGEESVPEHILSLRTGQGESSEKTSSGFAAPCSKTAWSELEFFLARKRLVTVW